MDRKVYIVGHPSMQEGLLVCHIHEKTGLDCVIIGDSLPLSSDSLVQNDFTELFILDCLGMGIDTLLNSVKDLAQIQSKTKIVALMNLNHSAGIERSSLEYGVRGFFYDEDSVETLIKGIEAIFSGEVWISRKILFKCLTNKDKFVDKKVSTVSLLTKREEQILLHLARGGTNLSIAKTLCISPHTVRTHIYNIFKKIDVSNRLQASLWAAKNLSASQSK